jgi:hypothetical protein
VPTAALIASALCTRAVTQAGVADSPTGTDSSSNGSSSSSSSELLSQRVKGNAQLITGQLSNGLRYVLLPNRTPPQRFEAHLEVHAGSVDEREHEQVRAVITQLHLYLVHLYVTAGLLYNWWVAQTARLVMWYCAWCSAGLCSSGAIVRHRPS